METATQENQVALPLHSSFRLLYRSLNGYDFSSLENSYANLVEWSSLRNGIREFLESEGGCMILSGHMGVGKTSFVNNVLADLKQDNSIKLIDIHISLARPIDPSRLKFKILRRLHKEFLGQDEHVYKKIETAYLKTLYSMKKTISNEMTETVDIGLSQEKKGTLLTPQLGAKLGKAIKNGLELEALAYDDVEAEDDIEEIFRDLSELYNKKPFWNRIWQYIKLKYSIVKDKMQSFFWGKTNHLKLVVILDELDKLDKTSDGQVEKLIESLKNIFSTTGISFILISGYKTLDRMRRERHGDVESVLGNMIVDTKYLPCLWDEIQNILSWVVNEEKLQPEIRTWYKTDFYDYLSYVSRGNFRQIIHTLTRWKSGNSLVFTAREKEQITEIATLQRHINEKVFSIPKASMGMENSWLFDNHRLEIYRLIDYILNLAPNDELTVGEKEFSHSSNWLNHKIPPQTTRFGVKLPALIGVLVHLGYLNAPDESPGESNND